MAQLKKVVKMLKTKIIECSPVWFETATTDTYNNAEKYEIRVSVVIDGETQVLQSIPLNTLRILCDKFTFYKFPFYSGFGETPDSSILANNFYEWNTRNIKNLERIVLAYLSKYNPIENYNGEMTVIDESETENPYTRTRTISGKVKTSQEVETITKSGTPTQNPDTFTDSEVKTYDTTFNNTTDPTGAKLKNRTTQTSMGGYGKTQVNPENNYQTWDNYAETETETGGKTHTETKHGNLGVTTSQSMVSDELKLRTHDIIVEYLYKYVCDNLYMGGECE